MTRSGSSMGLLDSIGEVGEGASRWDHDYNTARLSIPFLYLAGRDLDPASHLEQGEETEEAGLSTLRPTIRQVTVAAPKVYGHKKWTQCSDKEIMFHGGKGSFCSLVLWIIPGFYSLAQTKTLDNVMEKYKTFHIFPSSGFELLHKKPIWIFMGENTAS